MKCGNCKNSHPSVADVRACYEESRGGTLVTTTQKPKAYEEDSDFRERMRHVERQSRVPATEKQLAFLESLFPERNGVEFDRAEADNLTKSEASDLIQELLGKKKLISNDQKAGPQTGWPTAEELPAGYYAIDTGEGARNELAFYEVNRPTKGRWEGYCFISQVIGGNPNQRLAIATQKGVAKKILEAGAEKAALRYGLEIGQCCRCNRTLTNDESRAKGIGPVCEGAGGWFA